MLLSSSSSSPFHVFRLMVLEAMHQLEMRFDSEMVREVKNKNKTLKADDPALHRENRRRGVYCDDLPESIVTHKVPPSPLFSLLFF